MDLTEQLRTWATAHAQARRAEDAAQQNGDVEKSRSLRRTAKSLRAEADRLHREIYLTLDRRD